MHTLYMPTKASSLTKGWSFPVFGMLSSGALSSILFPLTELLCARSSDSAFSCIMINKNTEFLEIVLYLYKNFRVKITMKLKRKEKNQVQTHFIMGKILFRHTIGFINSNDLLTDFLTKSLGAPWVSYMHIKHAYLRC